MTTKTPEQEDQTSRQISGMADEILDYRATLARIQAATALDSIRTATQSDLVGKLLTIQQEAANGLGKRRRC